MDQLEYHGTKDKLKQERSKTHITFRDGGEVRVYSGNASNTKQTKSALMGFGAPNIILDEAGQISRRAVRYRQAHGRWCRGNA
jgi:hypothetical protein